jgi:proteasome activator subunit 4
MKDIVLMSIFSKTSFNDAIKAFQSLCFLRADIMIPALLGNVYKSFQVLTEPHRYTSMLACMVSVPREMVSFNANFASQVQLEIIPLMISVLPGFDVNDANKFVLTLQFLTNILGYIVVCDCSPAIVIREDLSEYEKHLCLSTSKFEDFIEQLFTK